MSWTGVSCGSIERRGGARLLEAQADTDRRRTPPGDRVSVLGAADARRFAGRKVDLRVDCSLGNRQDRSRIRRSARDGLFRAKLEAAAPHRLRGTNRARYEATPGRRPLAEPQATCGACSSTASRSTAARITIKGHVTRPLGQPASGTITVTRRVSCGRVEVAKRFRPRPDGTFTSDAGPAPRRSAWPTFRFRTKVRFDRSRQ